MICIFLMSVLHYTAAGRNRVNARVTRRGPTSSSATFLLLLILLLGRDRGQSTPNSRKFLIPQFRKSVLNCSFFK